jgi:hypothetical protein
MKKPWQSRVRQLGAVLAAIGASLACGGCLSAQLVASDPRAVVLLPVTLPIEMAVALASAEDGSEEEERARAERPERPAWPGRCEAVSACPSNARLACTTRRGVCKCRCATEDGWGHGCNAAGTCAKTQPLCASGGRCAPW